MSLISPNSIYPLPTMTHITPFTYRDGITYLEKLEALTAYVMNLAEELDAAIDAAIAANDTNTYAEVFSFAYTSNSVPPTGRIYVDNWSMSGTTVKLSETTDDGATLTFGVFDTASACEIRIVTADGKLFKATVTGPSVDNGVYRTLPVKPIEVKGTIPGDTVKVNVAMIVEL